MCWFCALSHPFGLPLAQRHTLTFNVRNAFLARDTTSLRRAAAASTRLLTCWDRGRQGEVEQGPCMNVGWRGATCAMFNQSHAHPKVNTVPRAHKVVLRPSTTL